MLLGSLGLLFLPMMWLSLAMFHTLSALNPFLIVASIARVWRDYLLAVGVLAVACAVRIFGADLLRQSIPLLGTIAGTFIALYLTIYAMHILGTLYRCNKEQLGWFARPTTSEQAS